MKHLVTSIITMILMLLLFDAANYVIDRHRWSFCEQGKAGLEKCFDDYRDNYPMLHSINIWLVTPGLVGIRS